MQEFLYFVFFTKEVRYGYLFYYPAAYVERDCDAGEFSAAALCLGVVDYVRADAGTAPVTVSDFSNREYCNRHEEAHHI